MYSTSVFHLPLPFQAYEALVYVGCNVRVYVKIELLDANLVDKSVDFPFQLFYEKYA